MAPTDEPIHSKRADDDGAVDEDDEPDDWDQRIIDTGCADENMALTDCYYEKKDWRQCSEELKAFKDCWETMKNNNRTSTQDN